MKVTVIKGDGIGEEIMDVTLKVLDVLKPEVECEIMDAGEEAMKKYGTPLPEETIQSIKKNKVAIKGPLTTPIGTGYRSVNVAIRQELDLFACLRPCKLYPGIKSRYQKIDLIIIRENTEDLYTGVEFPANSKDSRKIILMSGGRLRADSAISIKSLSYTASKRIIEFSFRYARERKRKKVTVVTKANILKYTDGLFLETAREISKKYNDIEFDEKLIDNMCMQLVIKPEIYDVIVLPNLYGDIVSDLCAGLVGGLGVVGSANIGDGIAVFEPVHGSAPKYKGLNKVNPIAMLLSLKMMLDHMNMLEEATKLESAISSVIREGKKLTYDLGGNSTTTEVGNEIIKKIKYS